jgi:diguanylate cyclase (GGDEF)-like protein
MSSPRTVPNSKYLAADSKQLHADESLSRKGRLEITIIIVIVLALFFAAQVLPTGEWLKLAAQHESSFIDEMILIFLVLSFVFPVFSIIRWRDLRREVAARALLVRQLEDGARINAQLSQMTNLLHSCFELQEASQIISHYARHLLPDSAGALYIFKASRNLLEMAADWGEEVAHAPTVAPQQCWALRQGQMYEVQNPDLSILCQHLHHPHPYICLPMMAHGEVLALLHVHASTGSEGNLSSTVAHRSLLRVFAEYIALALSNLKLRDTLRQQSIRDPLTGLFNRRYLEETLLIETERAKRKNEPFSIMMFDLDHFKRFNDTHGHEAGDAVLGALGRFLQKQVRGGDIACRYGGEEFTVILPGASLESAEKRAEQLCEGVRTLAVDFKGQSLGALSLSVGVATFPNHGDSAELVLQASDAALYQAKNEGRDRVAVAV